MKKKTLLLSSALFLLALASCGSNSSTSSAGEPASSSSAEQSVPQRESEPPVESSVAPSTSEESSLAEWVDYAHNGSVRLELDYTGRNFFADGVEKVTLWNTIDGDTAHFKSSNDEIIKARFYGIDTPESTGKIQPYGYDASDYTKKVLREAASNGTIVVSSAQDDYGKPNPDSTGSRYVSLIWVNTEKKDAGLDELYLLNLMIVQEGLSWVKAVSSMPQYADTFFAAESQAKAYKLKLHSGEPDQRMPSNDFAIVDLLDLKKAYLEEIAQHKAGNDSYVNPWDNKNVRLQGTVNGFANNTLYLADFCYYTDEEGNPIDDSKMEEGVTGEYASVNIFTGMGSIDTKYTTLGTYIEVCGTAQDKQFGFQITNTNFAAVPRKDTDARVILTAAENTEPEHMLHEFEKTASELQTAVESEDYSFINCRVHMSTPIKCTSFYKGDSKGDITLYFERPYSFRVYFTFKFKPFPDDTSKTWTEESQFVGKKFTFSGVYALHESTTGNISMQVYPSTTKDLVYVAE